MLSQPVVNGSRRLIQAFLQLPRTVLVSLRLNEFQEHCRLGRLCDDNDNDLFTLSCGQKAR